MDYIEVATAQIAETNGTCSTDVVQARAELSIACSLVDIAKSLRKLAGTRTGKCPESVEERLWKE